MPVTQAVAHGRRGSTARPNIVADILHALWHEATPQKHLLKA
jgi:hypothetical protein